MNRRRSYAKRFVAACGVLGLTAAPTSAHLVQTGFGTFYDGIVHLALTPVDLLVVLGLGFLSGLRGKESSRGLMLALPLAWLAGGLAGAGLPGAGELDWASAAAVLLVGALVAANAHLARPAIVALACAAGVLRGFVDGATMAPDGADFLALAGAVLAVFTLAALAPALVVNLRAEWTRIAVRVAGSWIAAIGLLMLGWLARPAP